MNLPEYFLADLPKQATLSPSLLGEACATLKRNRESYLLRRSTEQIIRTLSGVASEWLRPDDRFRRLALDHGPELSGFSRETLSRGLDGFFRQLTAENIRSLIRQELGDGNRLDQLTMEGGEQQSGRAAMAFGPGLLVHIAAGNIPNPALMSMVLGLLTRSAQFVKCARGAALLPRLFAHSIYEYDPKLAACIEVAEWPGGDLALEGVLFSEADCVTATGSDETLSAIKQRLPANVRFLGHGHRVSFGFVAADVLTGHHAKKIVSRAADDVTAWDQLGCLSPHSIYVQTGGHLSPEEFARELSEELARREVSEPRGKVSTELAAHVASRRAMYELRAAHSSETQVWKSQDSTAWTVVCESGLNFQSSCLHRFIYIKPVASVEDVLQSADTVRSHVSTVGMAVPEHRAGEIATQFARWGATRICPLGQMQNPPLTWRHDGRPALADMVSWADWEQ
jgi:hypothetical protein